MKNKIKCVAASVLAVILILSTALSASAYTDIKDSYTYTYNNDGKAILTPDAYTYIDTVKVRVNGETAKNLQDMFVADNGDIYLLDQETGTVIVLNSSFAIEKSINSFVIDGKTESFNNPEGIFVDENGVLYVADTQNQRIVRLTQDGNATVFEHPEGMSGFEDSPYYPSKIAVDGVGRIYVVARNINAGIVQLDSNGKFMSYLGAPSVKVDLWTKFWRTFSTDAQKAKMGEFVPTEYNNILLDSSEFIYGTISSLDKDDLKNTILSKDLSGTTTPVRRLNSMGEDVLRRKGFYAPLGDLTYTDDNGEGEPSSVIDVAKGGRETYTLLDYTRGRLFTYDYDGNLLFAFGSRDSIKGSFHRPTAICYRGDRLLVLDSYLGELLYFDPTDYGKLVLDAAQAQYDGDSEKAYALWEQIAAQNTNFQYAFVGLGKARMDEGKYEEAMEYFKYANDKQNYSDAKTLLRQQNSQIMFPIIFIVILVLVGFWFLWWIIRGIIRYIKKP